MVPRQSQSRSPHVAPVRPLTRALRTRSDIKNPPHQTPIRILVCFWWLSTIVIVNIYLGILFGQLVIPRRPKSIDTLEELANQDQVSWAVTRGSAIYELFRQSEPASVYGQLGRRMKLISSADEGVRQVLESNWAFIRERSILIFKVAQEHSRLKACRMQLAREQFYSVGFGLGLVKNSSYTRPFNSALTLMIENGLISHFQSMVSIHGPVEAARKLHRPVRPSRAHN